MGTPTDDLEPKILPGHIDVHPTDNAIVVNYTIQATILGENGQPVVGDRKAMQKIIRVKALHPNTNLAVLAEEVVEKCKLIHPSKVHDVEQLLYYLQQRQMNEGGVQRRRLEDSAFGDTPAGDAPPSIDSIEQYIEGLYEEMPDKISSTRSILQLARVPENMELLIGNDALMSALSRVLREDGKKSMELVTNIIYIFFCFSNFSQFHGFITTNKIGDMCLRITDQELARFNLWVQDLRKLEAKLSSHPDNSGLVRELEQEHQKFQTMIRKQDQLLFVAFHLLLNLAEDLKIEVKMVKRGIIKYLILMLDRTTPELLILVVTFLKKMSIFRENKDEMMQNCEQLLEKLDVLLSYEHSGLQNLTLRLIFNLSHDPAFRSTLMRTGMLKRLSEYINNKVHTPVALQLLYHISIEDETRAAFSYTDIIPLSIKMILENKGEKQNVELIALAINLASNSVNVAVICADNGLKFLMKRALKTRDNLLFKMLRNIAAHEGPAKLLFLDYIDDLMQTLFKTIGQPEITVEILGILNSLTIPDFDFAKLCEAFDLLNFVGKKLAQACEVVERDSRLPFESGVAESQQMNPKSGVREDDDITLEMLVLLGTMANDENIAPMVAKTTIIPVLMDLMIAKEEDDEIISQIIYVVYQFLLHESTRTILTTKTQVVSYLIDLLYDRNIEIRRMCDVCLDIISEIDDEWVVRIRHQKFHWHNSEWINLITQATGQTNSEDHHYEEDAVLDDDDDLYGSGMVIGGTSALLDGP
ncbi:kinesin-associated protein-domain-containing protein [Polychytrium aggregatum]|uniref:kinesin-associated protein-domain-containing protein n=1 Tax=Polychytrium aggregatum TaxID=110093 RepID=UPI0022FF1664|nr:kinesin-associated protein-domain-containing protein [Polychytrium aggregatum]KAI9207591.1 kinesin-associated protein-domain-containing protein [Polychytrium aggregatum]